MNSFWRSYSVCIVSWNSASSIGGGELNEIDRDIRADG
jgi:hypothetical protein